MSSDPNPQTTVLQRGIQTHTEFRDCDDVGQRLLLAVAGVADADGLAVGYTMRDLVTMAGVPRRAGERAHARLSVGGALFGFMSKDNVPVWVIPNYDDGQAPA